MENRKQGESVIVRTEEQFNEVKRLLGEGSLYLNWNPIMATKETAIVLKANKKTQLSQGGVGSAEYQRSLGIRTIEFSEYIKTE